MTIVSAWIRTSGSGDQMVVASDSRLTFGATWDSCPKIFKLGRNDSILAFCGDTLYAYPVVSQLVNSISNYEKSLSREMDITDLRGHFLKIMHTMSRMVVEKPKGSHFINPNDYNIMFAGFSHRYRKFQAWLLYYNKTQSKFDYHPLSFHKKRMGGSKPFLFMGDNVSRAMYRLSEKLRAKGTLKEGPLDMEPLEVIVDMINSGEYRAIGGPPQMVKIYSYANVLPINFLWPIEDPKYITHLGRPLLSYEGTKYATVDLRDGRLLSPQEAYSIIESKI